MMASVSGRRISMRAALRLRCCAMRDRAAQRLDVAAHHVHADAAAGEVGDLLGGGEAGLEDQLAGSRSSGGVTPCSTRPRSQARCSTLSRWMPRPSSLMRITMLPDSWQAASVSRALRRLAGGQALLGRLQAVVQRVAHQVHQRVGDALDHRLVQLGVAADDLQRDVLAELGRGVAHHAPEAREGLADRHHAQLQRAVADVLDQAADLLVGLDQRAAGASGAPAARRRRRRSPARRAG